MLRAIFVIVVALAYSQSGANRRAVGRRPFNNRYSDASGAREDHLG